MCKINAVLVATLYILLSFQMPGRGEEPTSIGALVMLKQGGIRAYPGADAKKRTSSIQTWIVREVLEQNGDRVRVCQNDESVWLAKDDVLAASNAVPFFTSLIAHNKLVARNYACRAVAWHVLQKYDNALADHDEAISLDSTNAEAFQNRAITRMAK